MSVVHTENAMGWIDIMQLRRSILTEVIKMSLPPMKIRFEKTSWKKNGVEIFGYKYIGCENVLEAKDMGEVKDEYILCGYYVYLVSNILLIYGNNSCFTLAPGDKITKKDFRHIQKAVHQAGTRFAALRRKAAWVGIEEIIE
jgi:hypothetical protein